ncbi:2-C-methyl-D-erythritol 4-phosphate cytidylyltransferase [Kerstersia similis]|uniref:2-C-methyl-D-erythritol 4-phosphate cytidylyltransferase n=1 Tax=Kerstersia similis TaxID=206505 RepID=UPI0039EF5E9B
MTEKLIAIVPAAGIGKRASRHDGDVPKQYRPLRGEPVLRLAVQALLADPRVAEVRVAVAPADCWAADALAGLPRVVCRPCGGAERADTVANALDDACEQAGLAERDWVLVHDAARPGLPALALSRLIDACLTDAVGGLLALPAADTVKQGRDRVACTLPREEIWLAQTPQMFRAGLLRAALAQARAQGRVVTDEASAMEMMGHAPMLVRGSPRNAKLTWSEDFDWMENWG